MGSSPLPTQSHFLKSICRTAVVCGDDSVRMMTGLLKLACKRLGMPAGMVIRIEGETYTVLASYDSEGDRLPVGKQASVKQTPCDRVFEKGEMLIEDDLDDCMAKYPNCCIAFRRYVGVPITVDRQVIGTMCFVSSEVSREPLRVNEEEISVLSLIVAGAVERLLYLESERELRETASIVKCCEDAIFTVSRGGKVTKWNAAAMRLFGYRAEEAIGIPIQALFTERDETLVKALIGRVLEGHSTEGLDTVNVTKDRREISTSLTLSPIPDEDGRVGMIAVVVRDMGEKKLAELALAMSEQRYALAARGSNDGLWDLDIVSGQAYYSPRWKAILGYSEDQVEPTLDAWRGLIHPDDLAQFDADLSAHLSGRADNFCNEHRAIARGGTEHWVRTRGVAVRDGAGRAVRIAGSLTDINQQKQFEAALIHQARKDKLTGLANRDLFTEILRSTMARAKRKPRLKFAVLFLDFDRFKVINDSLGHEFGDMLLVNIAQQLRVHLRTTDVAARLGGDEFVVLLDDIEGLGGAIEVAERLLACFSRPHSIGGHEVTSTASIGIVTNDGDYTKPQQMIRDADTAMYQAKAAGKARYVVFDEQMHAKALQRLNLEKELRRAIPLSQLWLAYQPIVSLLHGELRGFEALVRWQHPELGPVPPDTFIEIAEETGEIVTIGNWVMQQACRQLAEWKKQYPQAGDLYMNVNLSRRQLTQPDAINNLKNTMKFIGVNPRDVKLEITESTIMDDRHEITPVLNEIKALGVQLAMDDFGTGHSSLSCLHRFPLDVLKIDREFIHNMEHRVAYTAVIQAIVTLAHTIGIRVVAEGLETKEQVAQLQALECDDAQGYYFSKPLTASDAEKYLLGAQARQSA